MLSAVFIGILAVAGDTLSLAPAVVSSVKEEIGLERIAAPVSRIRLDDRGLQEEHSLSQKVPGLHIPDYGASLTSTIYIRGLGSRMENPSLGLYLDGIPVLDKNAYDFDWSGIRSGVLLRGPQGTLYGRNSMGGVLVLKTARASEQDGISGVAEAGTAGHFLARLSAAVGEHSLSGSFRHESGYFTNTYTGREVDPYIGGNIDWRWDRALSEATSISHTLHLTCSDEGGFAYGMFIGGKILPVKYNDEGSYRRLSLLDGVSVRHTGRHVNISTVASVQLLVDRMRMDQDFTPESIFTLEQKQRNLSVTGEVIITPVRKFRWWRPQTGFFCFGRMNLLRAPVLFKEDGIRTLILDNANRNIPESIGYLDISDNSFPVESDFNIWSWNAALYHQSVWEIGDLVLTAGIRLDYEGAYMDYDSRALIHYRFVPFMSADRPVETSYSGGEVQHFFQVSPKVSVLYGFPLTEKFTLAPYGNISKGFRAGGFNTQIFSDILQGMMMTDIMDDLGVHLDSQPGSVLASHTKYRPEEAWNYEIGLRFLYGRKLRAELSGYLISCRNQQLTVFPPGKSTGRMMTNAGRSRNSGVEAELDYRGETFRFQASYGWCRAVFLEYSSGGNDYSGHRIPYVPEHSFFTEAKKTFRISEYRLSVAASLRGAGPFVWNEENTRSSAFALSLGGVIAFSAGNFGLYLRGENLLGRQDPTFYFKSVGNEFFALSKPRRITVGINFKL